ncbi:hypothetical protein Sjap_004941 [Stephania japonica]|uniref:Uncharacterized protein n=1 Tax=Stephania japonica TaxID=461633 RepID=A0AAP0K4N0_9MAGN
MASLKDVLNRVNTTKNREDVVGTPSCTTSHGVTHIRVVQMNFSPRHRDAAQAKDFEKSSGLTKSRLAVKRGKISIAFPDDGAWKRFYKQLQHFPMFEKRDGTPTDQLSSIKQTLKDLQRKRKERMKEFCDIQSQIIQVHEALRGSAVDEQIVDDKDLTTKRLRELKLVLQGLQSEKTKLEVSDKLDQSNVDTWRTEWRANSRDYLRRSGRQHKHAS